MNNPVNTHQAIAREIRTLKEAVRARDQVIAAVAQIVGVKGEALSAKEIASRVGTMRSSLVSAASKVMAMEKVLAAAGACDVDGAGTCHAHGGAEGCPIAALRALCAPPARRADA